MALTAGTRIGVYEVTGVLGAGGMGQVYRATDTNLGRQVAIKVLLDTFAHDPERLARFEREAKTLAALNHPNIAQIYGVVDAAPESMGDRDLERSRSIVQGLVMELVEGPTLADRVKQGPIPVDEALTVARQIAAALEAAHEQGIVHRDLKPANVKVRPDGAVKVLDFGLAKALTTRDGATSSAPDATASPTLMSPAAMTSAGLILGTAAYMAPEQARGKPVDRRADIWAFGCVLFEMLTGKRAFEGDEVSDTLAGILRGDPDWKALPVEASQTIRRLLRRCLEKNPRERLQAIGDARLEIADALRAPEGEPATAGTMRQRSVPAIVAVAAAVTALVVGVSTWLLKPAPPDAGRGRSGLPAALPATDPGRARRRCGPRGGAATG